MMKIVKILSITLTFKLQRITKMFFTKQEIEGEDTSRDYQEHMCFPSITDLQSYVGNNLIENCGFSLNNVNWAKVIYGPAVPDL